MQTIYRVQASANLYGDAAQTMSNTWYYQGGSASSEAQDIAEITSRIIRFYQAIDSSVFPSSVVGNQLDLLVYDMADPEPRVPIADESAALANGGGGAFPSDIAICLSYHGVYESGVNRARRRGRLFIGPVLAATGVAVTGQGIRVQPSIVTTILAAALDLDNMIATPATWMVYSPTDNAAHAIVQASIDNGFDTRRSRDNRETVREAVTIVP